MHVLQKKILQLAKDDQLNGKKLREIGAVIGEENIQKVKHHLNALANKNLLFLDFNGGYQVLRQGTNQSNSNLINIPLYGSANCGIASLYAENSIEGYLKIAKFPSSVSENELIALKAVGKSMNRAVINGQNVNSNDYLIVDTSIKNPQDGDYVLCILDNMAVIKRYSFDERNNEIRLISESTNNIPPIVIRAGDDASINGKVIKVIKSD